MLSCEWYHCYWLCEALACTPDRLDLRGEMCGNGNFYSVSCSPNFSSIIRCSICVHPLWAQEIWFPLGGKLNDSDILVLRYLLATGLTQTVCWMCPHAIQVRFAELRFDSPPLGLGRGTFGQVFKDEIAVFSHLLTSNSGFHSFSRNFALTPSQFNRVQSPLLACLFRYCKLSIAVHQ